MVSVAILGAIRAKRRTLEIMPLWINRASLARCLAEAAAEGLFSSSESDESESRRFSFEGAGGSGCNPRAMRSAMNAACAFKASVGTCQVGSLKAADAFGPRLLRKRASEWGSRPHGFCTLSASLETPALRPSTNAAAASKHRCMN